MQKLIFLVLLLPVLVIPAFALESDTEYFIDSKNIFLIISVDSTNKIILDGVITVNNELHEFEEKQIKVIRITDDGNHGRIFGKTTQGYYYYVIYDIKDDDTVKLYSKLWHNNTQTRLIEDASIDKLF